MTNQTKKVLSIDGGGIRGAAAARFLKRLDDALFEKEKKRLRDLVDLYAGTSTGAIIALALANTNLTMDTISDLYSVKVARNIFKSNRGLFEIDGINAPKYEGEGKTKTFNKYFGRVRLGEIAQGKHVLVVAYEIARRKPVVFKTTKPSHKNLKSADIADATSAAPTYFPTVKMKLDGLDAWLVDGGVVANNPTMCAISEALSAWETTIDKVKVLSVGTGYRTRKINGPASRDWGAVQWFLQGSLIDLLSDERIVEHQSATILPPANYLRVNSELSRAVIDPAPDDAMDDIDADNIRKLVKLGDIWFEKYGDDAIKLLLS